MWLIINRNRKREPPKAAGMGINPGVYANNLSFPIQQRATRTTGIDRYIGLGIDDGWRYLLRQSGEIRQLWLICHYRRADCDRKTSCYNQSKREKQRLFVKSIVIHFCDFSYLSIKQSCQNIRHPPEQIKADANVEQRAHKALSGYA